LPPIDPRALRRDRYRYFVRLVRSGFRHAGALRIDHVMGLFRLFWIPEGKTGKEGAYVRFPAEDLLGILALESVRHHALVVGEDLGTVPKEVPPTLERFGVLSSKVLYFERDKRGFRPAERYPALALATANTHDMATLRGFWEGRDIEQRAKVGLIPDESAAARAREEREKDKKALLTRLAREGALASPKAPNDEAELRGAIHEFLCRTPAALVGLALDDLAGEAEAVNLPGVGPDKHPSWRRKMGMTIDEMRGSEEVRAALRCSERGERSEGGAWRVPRDERQGTNDDG
jgi:4-alpha-glucanotransferase